jgi:hypothetical protein
VAKDFAYLAAKRLPAIASVSRLRCIKRPPTHWMRISHIRQRIVGLGPPTGGAQPTGTRHCSTGRIAGVFAVAGLAAGFVFGCLASDYAVQTGFPHAQYEVELDYSPSARAAWKCTRLGTAYGADLSAFNDAKNVQESCVLLVTGELLPDGSLNVYLGASTWTARWMTRNNPPRHFPVTEIRAVRRVSF